MRVRLDITKHNRHKTSEPCKSMHQFMIKCEVSLVLNFTTDWSRACSKHTRNDARVRYQVCKVSLPTWQVPCIYSNPIQIQSVSKPHNHKILNRSMCEANCRLAQNQVCLAQIQPRNGHRSMELRALQFHWSMMSKCKANKNALVRYEVWQSEACNVHATFSTQKGASQSSQKSSVEPVRSKLECTCAN